MIRYVPPQPSPPAPRGSRQRWCKCGAKIPNEKARDGARERISQSERPWCVSCSPYARQVAATAARLGEQGNA